MNMMIYGLLMNMFMNIIIAIRILPGQNPRSVFIGWTTSRFKPIHEQADTSIHKLTKLIRHCTITQTD